MMRLSMIAIALCATTGLAIAADTPATEAAKAATDQQNCKQFISGTWTSKPGDAGKAVSVEYRADGSYRQEPASAPEGGAADGNHPEETGAWLALETEPLGGCILTLTPSGGEERKFTLTIVDDKTVKADDGTISTRTEGVMEPHTSP